jgi:hypothetical protein
MFQLQLIHNIINEETGLRPVSTLYLLQNPLINFNNPDSVVLLNSD